MTEHVFLSYIFIFVMAMNGQSHIRNSLISGSAVLPPATAGFVGARFKKFIHVRASRSKSYLKPTM